MWRRVLELGDGAIEAGDDGETRTKKRVLATSTFLVSWALLPIGLLYLGFGETLVGAIYVGFVGWLWLNLVVFVRWHRSHRVMATAIAVVAMPGHLFIALVLGGWVESGAIVMWGLAFPVVTGLLFFTPREVALFFLWFTVNVLVATLVELPGRAPPSLPQAVVLAIFIANLLCVSALVTVVLAHFVRALNAERARSEALLLNILPRDVATILKSGTRLVADRHAEASILFADVVGFTPMSAAMTPEALVELLNEVFSGFDDYVERHGLEKIKTIGDCYMVAAGAPTPREDHAAALTRLALDMRAMVEGRAFNGRKLQLRVGINSGPVVAGVIGHRKFAYDLWGDTVNVASRMESSAEAGSIRVAPATYALIGERFECRSLGRVSVRGRGEMEVWQVLGEKGAAVTP
jgi:guanylate cyclase